MNKFFAIILLLGVLVSFSKESLAQQDHVKWKLRLEQVDRMEYEIIIHAVIDSGWYIWPTVVPNNGPIPTKISLDDNKDIEVIGTLSEQADKTELHHYDRLDTKIKKYSESATFIQKIRLKAESTLLIGKVLFVTFNNENKIRPDQFQFAVRVSN